MGVLIIFVVSLFIGCVISGTECHAYDALGCVACNVDLDGLNAITEVVAAKRTDFLRRLVGSLLVVVDMRLCC